MVALKGIKSKTVFQVLWEQVPSGLHRLAWPLCSCSTGVCGSCCWYLLERNVALFFFWSLQGCSGVLVPMTWLLLALCVYMMQRDREGEREHSRHTHIHRLLSWHEILNDSQAVEPKGILFGVCVSPFSIAEVKCPIKQLTRRKSLDFWSWF